MLSTSQHYFDQRSVGGRFRRRRLKAAGGLLGVALLFLNLVGLVIPLRSPAITADFADFARPSTTSYESAMETLDALTAADPETLASKATQVFFQGMAHVDPKDAAAHGLELYRMRVPAWENYLLFGLSYLKPDTYRDYEFSSFERALERGTGRCGQQALALVSFLSQQGLKTGFVDLGGHTLATVEVSPGLWHLLDPDYGAVIPFDLQTAEANPSRVLEYYRGTAAEERGLAELYEPKGNELWLGGPEARWGRASSIELLFYWLKWVLPLVLIGGSLGAVGYLRVLLGT